MHHQQPMGKGKQVQFGGLPQRPKTAATTTVADEKRIKDKIKYLDDVLDRIDDEVLKTADKIDIDLFRG